MLGEGGVDVGIQRIQDKGLQLAADLGQCAAKQEKFLPEDDREQDRIPVTSYWLRPVMSCRADAVPQGCLKSGTSGL